MEEATFVSKCCRVEATEGEEHGVEWFCGKCRKPCEVEEVCAWCLGEGEYSTDEDDGEGHTMRGVGTAKCPCTRPTDGEDGYERD